MAAAVCLSAMAPHARPPVTRNGPLAPRLPRGRPSAVNARPGPEAGGDNEPTGAAERKSQPARSLHVPCHHGQPPGGPARRGPAAAPVTSLATPGASLKSMSRPAAPRTPRPRRQRRRQPPAPPSRDDAAARGCPGHHGLVSARRQRVPRPRPGPVTLHRRSAPRQSPATPNRPEPAARGPAPARNPAAETALTQQNLPHTPERAARPARDATAACPLLPIKTSRKIHDE